MQKLPTKVISQGNTSSQGTGQTATGGLNLKAIIENQKIQGKIRKPSGNRFPAQQQQYQIENNSNQQQKSSMKQDRQRKSTTIKTSQHQIQTDPSFIKQMQAVKLSTIGNHRDAAQSEIFHFNDYYKSDEGNKKKRIDLEEALRVEEYTNSQSPKGHNEYTMMGSGCRNEGGIDIDDCDYQEIEQDIKIPAFLNRGSLEPKDPSSKNQFYMTQVLHSQPHNGQTRQNNMNQYSINNSYVNTKNVSSLVSSNLKLPRSKLKQSTAKKNQSSINKSQIIKNIQNKQSSPNAKAKDPLSSTKFMNINDFGSYGGTDQNTQQRINLNTSALITSSKDILNATAPINMNQITKMYQDEAITQGFSDTVNSTQNLKRMNSKDTYHEQQQNFQSYYSGVMGTKSNMMRTTGGVQSKQSMSPMKQAKKQMLIQTLLSQEKPKSSNQNNKYFLNLTLQQLIQQQHQDNSRHATKFHNYQRKISSNTNNNEEINIQNQQKRLNKTLDNFKDQYMMNNYSNQQMDGAQHKRKNNPSNASKQGKTNGSNSKNKFSSTMRISDFNQTQIFDSKLNTQNIQKSKNSLKSTQNLNFQNTNDDINNNIRKTSALSTYSMNTAQTTTTHLMKQSAKNMKNIGAQNGNFDLASLPQNQTTKSKHKRQGSQEKELIKKILNFYQDDFLQQFGIGTANAVNPSSGDKKQTYSSSKIQQSAIGKIQQSKHKPNSTLNQYLNNKSGAYNDLIFTNANQLNEMNQQQQYHPYAQTRQRKNGGSSTSAYTKKEHIKELQNKTQPIPKTLLDIAQNQAANLSTGTSVAFPKGNSKEINNKEYSKTQKNQNSSNNRPTSKTRTGNSVLRQPVTNELPAPQDHQKMQQAQQEQQKPKIGKRKDIEIKDKIADDNPIDVYNNKNTVILDEEFQNNESDNDEQSKLDRYILGKQIGQGAYAVVRLATSKKDNKKYAIKVYDKSKLTDTNRQRSVRREIKLLQKMNHPNIVKIFEAFETENHVYLVMEYVGGGSLHSYLKEKSNRRLDEEDAKRIFKQIMTALQYCHRKSIAHRDIKLENILLDEDKNVKLIDFGFSTCIPNDKKIKMFCGTPSYMAPEIVMKEEYAGPPADIWASAVLLYALMNGCFPFRGTTDKELYRRIQRGSFLLHNQNLTDQFVEILQKMLNVNADLRPKAEDILQDQWFQIDSSKIIKQGCIETDGDSIADQKRLFKDKILGKIPVEKNKNTICLNGSQENIKNHQFIRNTQNNNNINNTNAYAQPNVNINTDFSDYGIPNNNAMKKLNQEAYQAYYNTSGGNFGGMGQNIQNPYYNNFFQNNYINNIQQPNPHALGFYPNQGFINNQMRQSPQKNNLTINPNIQMNFNNQPGQNIGTPQVFGSPTGAIHCGNGIYDLQINCDAANQMNRPQIICNITQVTCFSPTNHPNNLLQTQQTQQQQQQQPNNDPNNNVNMKNDPQDLNKRVSDNNNLEVDEDIISSITQLGYQRSHVVSQLQNDSSNISNIYAKLKEEKMSQTQNRPLSLQPHRKTYYQMKGHNNAIFPQFVPSLPDSIKAGFACENEANNNKNNEGLLNYYDNEYNVGASPKQQQKQSSNGSIVSQ